MSPITVRFIKCAMLYFVVAMALGIYMTVTGPSYPLIPIHTHFNLLGWMSMMIYGVGYHILPRFSGVPLWSEKLATAHLWTANIGLLGMALGWVIIAKGSGIGVGAAILHGFSILEGVSIVFFVVNIFKTIKAVPPPPPKKA